MFKSSRHKKRLERDIFLVSKGRTSGKRGHLRVRVFLNHILLLLLFVLSFIGNAYAHDTIPLNGGVFGWVAECDLGEYSCISSGSGVLDNGTTIPQSHLDAWANHHGTDYLHPQYGIRQDSWDCNAAGSHSDTGWKQSNFPSGAAIRELTFSHYCTMWNSFTGAYPSIRHHVVTISRTPAECPLYHYPDPTLWQCNHNQPPYIQMAPTGTVSTLENQIYSDFVYAADPDTFPNTSLTYSMEVIPFVSWLSIDSATGDITGYPVFDDAGFYDITVKASDGEPGAEAIATYTLEVVNVNRSPVFSNPNITASASTAMDDYSYPVPAATDPDFDGITYRATIVDADWVNFSFDPSTRVITGMPRGSKLVSGMTEVLTQTTVTITADDGQSQAKLTVKIPIQPNQPPVVNVETNYQVYHGQPLTINATATDPEDQTLTWLWQADLANIHNLTKVDMNTPSPTITYTGPIAAPYTTYDVLLQVEDNAGHKVQKNFRVRVTKFSETQNLGLNEDIGSNSCGTIQDHANQSLLEGNPVNGATGNKYQAETDYVGAGRLPLIFTRYYNSYSEETTLTGIKWRHHYDRKVVLDASQTVAEVYRPSGNTVPFDLVGGQWTARPGVIAQLEEVTTPSPGWIYTTSDDAKEHYNQGGQLQRITTREGRSLVLAYTSGKLTGVSDETGRSLTFEYDPVSGLLNKLIDPAGQAIIYGHDAQGNLTTVEKPTHQLLDGSIATVTRTYIYDDQDAQGNPRHIHALTGITDENGVRFATYVYDDLMRVVSETHVGNADNMAFSYNVDALTSLPDGTTTITDAQSQTRTYNYITQNDIVKLDTVDKQCNSCAGTSASNTYDANGFLKTRTDFKGVVTDYTFNARGLLEQRIDAQGTPLERTSSTVWHAQYRLPTCLIGPTATTANDYDAKGRILKTTLYDTSDAIKFPTAQSKQCSEIALRGDRVTLNQRSTSYSYYPDTNTTGDAGLLNTIDGPRTDVPDITTYTYDGQGNISTITNALGHVTTYSQYDAHGRPGRVTDPNGLVTAIKYDLQGRQDTVTVGEDINGSVVGEETNYVYDGVGKLKQVTFANGSHIVYTYDDAHRLTDIEDHLGNRVHYTLDDMGNRIKTETFDPQNNLKRLQSAKYNIDNRLEELRNAAATPLDVTINDPADPANSEPRQKFIEYDANGNLILSEDAAGNQIRMGYDALNRMETMTSAVGTPQANTTTYAYDAKDRLVSVTDQKGLVTSYQHDGLGNLLKLTSPDSGITNYTEYDAAGNLKVMTDARGVTASYTYDALNRIETITYDDGTNTTTDNYSYDDVVTNGKGRLHTITSNGTTITYAYDKHGRVREKMQSDSNGATMLAPLTVIYEYNPQGQLSVMTTPGGRSIEYGYTLGQLTSIKVDNDMLIDQIGYDPFGPMTNWSWGNGSLASRSYNLDGQLARYPLGAGERSLSYYPTGLLQSITDSINTANQQSFVYDPLFRLKDYIAPNPEENESYTYDVNGTRETMIRGTQTPQTYTNTIALNSNRIDINNNPTAQALSYDPMGHQTGDGVHAYSYDLRGRLQQVVQGTNSLDYTLNGLGQRIRKAGNQPSQSYDINGDGIVDGKDVNAMAGLILGDGTQAQANADCTNDTNIDIRDAVCLNNLITANVANATNTDLPTSTQIRFAYDESGHTLGEYDLNGKASQEIVWLGHQPIAVLQGSSQYYIHSDHLNTPRAIVDQNDQTIWSWQSDPYGSIKADEDPDGDNSRFVFNLRFPGQYYDAETGLHYNYFRDYNPKTGMYIQSDPIGIQGGINTYAYANSDPVNAIDPTGECGTGICVAAIMLGEQAYLCARNPNCVGAVATGLSSILAATHIDDIWEDDVDDGSWCANEPDFYPDEEDPDDPCEEWRQDLLLELKFLTTIVIPSNAGKDDLYIAKYIKELNINIREYNKHCVPLGHVRIPPLVPKW
ncbi:MAG: RHS repeat-associated core domain-containing protein [Gammaproteobacteria bacterium]